MKAKEADKFKQLPDEPQAADIAGAEHGYRQGDEPAGHDHGHMHGDEAAGHDHGHTEGDGGGGHDHGSMLESTRCVDYAGHKIEIKTCYEITVDGKPITPHLSVRNDGTLHTHAMPNYVFSSAVDLVKKIIDLFPDEFSSDQQGHGHGGHTHEHT